MSDASVEMHIGLPGKRGSGFAGNRDQLGALPLDQRDDRQQFGRLARVGYANEDVFRSDHAEVAMPRLGGVDKKRGCAGAGHRGRDLACYVPGFPYPAHHHAALAGQNQAQRLQEAPVNAADEGAHRVSFDFEHPSRQGEGLFARFLVGLDGSAYHRHEV